MSYTNLEISQIFNETSSPRYYRINPKPSQDRETRNAIIRPASNLGAGGHHESSIIRLRSTPAPDRTRDIGFAVCSRSYGPEIHPWADR